MRQTFASILTKENKLGLLSVDFENNIRRNSIRCRRHDSFRFVCAGNATFAKAIGNRHIGSEEGVEGNTVFI